MNYYVVRQGQQFGPYTLADLQRYLAQGNISPDDLAHSEGMVQLVPVREIVGNIAVPQAQPVAPQSYGQLTGFAPPAVTAGPLPPGLHWGLVLLFTLLSCGIFSIVWAFVEASFVKKIKPESNAVVFYAIGFAGAFVSGFIGAIAGQDYRAFSSLLQLGCYILIIVGHFSLKNSLEEYYTSTENINLQLSGVMTFFFNFIYFQYHFSRIRTWKLTGVLS